MGALRAGEISVSPPRFPELAGVVGEPFEAAVDVAGVAEVLRPERGADWAVLVGADCKVRRGDALPARAPAALLPPVVLGAVSPGRLAVGPLASTPALPGTLRLMAL